MERGVGVSTSRLQSYLPALSPGPRGRFLERDPVETTSRPIANSVRVTRQKLTIEATAPAWGESLRPPRWRRARRRSGWESRTLPGVASGVPWDPEDSFLGGRPNGCPKKRAQNSCSGTICKQPETRLSGRTMGTRVWVY